ncbi:DUF4407 domain-containing protein [Streptomyces radicis]|uniref:DUF4407 domain-containing protein n=1 Tax=Streptomyces radicis TaxID=1750517 RepID=UPI001E303EF8|nr:DUF4407 domain-containing protein [Streptomyces radicis]
MLKPPDGFGPPEEGPSPSRLDPGRRLRVLTGVDESLLAWVWHERGKYTALGGVVLGTAVIAGFSMWNFANQALGRASVLSLLPAAMWTLFVLNLDRWLITPQPNVKRRLSPLLTRLLVAVVLGVVVAEPLVLRIFQSAVEEHVRDERNDTVDALRADLLRCNPDPSEGGTRPEDCGSFLLSFDATPASLAAELTTLRADAGELRERVDEDTRHLEALDADVRDECRRLIRNAATGYLERTSECLRLRENASEYRATHRTEENETRLAGMNARIAEIEADLTSSRGDYLAARDAAVEQRVSDERDQQREIGVLERIAALHELTGRDTVLLIGVWMVRLLFVFVDVLPVLVKFLNGESSYDRLLAARTNGALRIHDEAVRTVERRAVVELEIDHEVIEQGLLRRKAEIDADRREHVAAMNIRVSQAVSALQEELARTSVR